MPILKYVPSSLSQSPATTAPTSSTTLDSPKPTEDEELAKLKARAARFGLPLIEPAKPTVPAATKGTSTTKIAAAAPDVSLVANTCRVGALIPR